MPLRSVDFGGSYMVTQENSLNLKTPLGLFWDLWTCGGTSGMLRSPSGIGGGTSERSWKRS